jgi:hypothetical protein
MSFLVPKVFKFKFKKKAHATPPSTPGRSPGTGEETLITLQAALTILKDSVDGLPIPGLKASLAGLLAFLTAARVCYFTSHPLTITADSFRLY